MSPSEIDPCAKMHDKLASSLGKDSVSMNQSVLDHYSKDDSFAAPQSPAIVAWPRGTQDVQFMVRSALEHGVPIVAVSSPQGPRRHGDTVPSRPGSMVMDLSRMGKIIRIDRRNRVMMVEPGVTFGELIPEAEKHGLRLLHPLCPRRGKSVLASALEREPITIPRYHWDTSDPLLCTELVFGTGDVFRTGSAAGPGTVEEQLAAGSAQKNPMGPTQFSPSQLVQGAQGSLAVVTWATLKCELKPTLQRVRYVNSDELNGLTAFAYGLLKFRIGDEIMLLNKRAFASLVASAPEDRGRLVAALKEWVLLAVISGRGESAVEKVAYLEEDMGEQAKTCGVAPMPSLDGVDNERVLAALSSACDMPWQHRSRGACQSVFFLTTLDRVSSFVTSARELLRDGPPFLRNFGVYAQPMLQGCNCHLEFQLYYDPKSVEETDATRKAFTSLSQAFMENGAFFSRPYGEWAAGMYARVPDETVATLRKVKKIFDPEGILKPGTLCFKEGLP